MNKQTVMIFGGSGFLGKSIIRRLIAQGHRVIGVTRSIQTYEEDSLNQVEWHEGDVFAPESWRDLLQSCDTVIHLVGIVRETPEKGLTYQHVIGDSVRLVADEAEKTGVERFVYLSGDLGATATPLAYREAKKAAEDYLRTKSFTSIMIRPSMVYGEDKPETIARREMILNSTLSDSPEWEHRPVSAHTVADLVVSVVEMPYPELIYNAEDILARESE